MVASDVNTLGVGLSFNTLGVGCVSFLILSLISVWIPILIE